MSKTRRFLSHLRCSGASGPKTNVGEEPVAVVTLKPGSALTEASLRAFAAERIAGFKAPVRIIMQEEMLPRNANGKILKRELRKLFVA